MRGSEDASVLIGDIYDAALDVGQWPRVLERLARGFGSASAHLSTEDFAMTEGRLISFGTDPAYAQRYADYYARCNVLWQHMVRRPLDRVMTNRTIMPMDELRRSEFYNDFLRPQDGEEILISVALPQADRATTLTLWRPERLGAWESQHMTALAALTPHLRRALRVNQSTRDLRTAHDLASEALHRLDHGVIFAGAQAQVLFANRAAEAMLADAGGLRLERRRLAARRASDTAILRRLIAAAAQAGTGGSLVIARDERPSLMVLVTPAGAETCRLMPDRPGAILFIKDLEHPARPSLTAFVQHFGLTPAQAALAREMMRGEGVAAVAARLGIAYTTARTHLLQIFQKTETRRQAELVRLMLEWSEGSLAAENDKARRRCS